MSDVLGIGVQTTAGAKLEMSRNLPAALNLAGFQAVTEFVDISEVTNYGNLTRSFASVNHSAVDRRMVQTLKGTMEANEQTIELGRIKTDEGQLLLDDYCDGDKVDDHATFRITLKDGTVYYFCALVKSLDTILGEANTITGYSAVLAINTKVFTDVGTMHTLKYTAGDNGIVVGRKIQLVAEDADGEYVVAVPDVGYEFSKWNDDVETAVRQDTAVTDDVDVTAVFVDSNS
jgi:hypothetical protein